MNSAMSIPFPEFVLSRRSLLARAANGFGAAALAGLMADPSYGNDAALADGLHHPATAKNVIFLYMDGGPSQVDTFDPKPLLTKENGQPFKMAMQPTQFDNNGNTLGSPWKFQQYGESGLPISDLFPHVGQECRRVVRHPVDDVGVLGAHQCQLLPAHRAWVAGPTQHGGVGDVRPGERVP